MIIVSLQQAIGPGVTIETRFAAARQHGHPGLFGERLDLDWLRGAARTGADSGHWDRLAMKALIASLYDAQRRGTVAVIASMKKGETPEAALARWWAAQEKGILRYERLIRDLKSSDTRNLATLVVALQSILAI